MIWYDVFMDTPYIRCMKCRKIHRLFRIVTVTFYFRRERYPRRLIVS